MHSENEQNVKDMGILSIINCTIQHVINRVVFLSVPFFVVMMVQAQTQVCMSYDDFVANQWKPYESLTEDRQPDSCR